ncbi:MAG TPA: ABC transporter [Erysipelotrichaceae bacterium]|uniref:ABC transporter ATP-binding protein n=1 Tax=uncultured Sharpea sp. TaxID=1112738 RepID=UPI000EDE3593|nr:ABC transporter ATP-binding protein [uncultured Sharpea sp.]HAJ16451.1 ABC transporter [Erysipelotrichaceae bacterium]HBZ52063.1 ABC transporter [Erysipelotrichaceae bacterium]HBZ88483.1 ABC transporter [Erysipelotrichaceae bacterium]
MFRLRKYFKKYWALFLIAIVMILGQAASELALPDYMSNIVSNGIQAGGFKDAVSDVLTTDTYHHILLFANEKEQTVIKRSYRYTKEEKLDSDIKKTFPKAKNIYVLKDDINHDELNKAMLKSMLIVSSIEDMDKNSESYKKLMGQLTASVASFRQKYEQAYNSYQANKNNLPEATRQASETKLAAMKTQLQMMEEKVKEGDVFYFIGAMPEDSRNKMFDSIDKQMKTMGNSTMNIAGGNAVKSEYKRLGANTDDIQNAYVFQAGVKMLVIALLGAVASIAAAFFASKTGAAIARDLRLDLFKKVESFSTHEMDQFSTASLITRSTNDITQIQQVVVMFIRLVCFAPVLGLGAFVRAIQQSKSMTGVIGLVLIVILGVLGVTFSIVLPKFKIIQSLIDKLNLAMRENLSGVLVIRAFGNEKEAERRFDVSNTDLTKVNLFVNRVMISLMPIMMFIMNAVTLAIVYVGAKQIDLGHIQIGQMMAFLQYGMMIIMGFLMIAMIAIMLPRASISAKRIADVLETENSIVEPAHPEAFPDDQRGVVTFDHVSFAYPGSEENVLSDISFTAKPGQTTAFIGSTGSGKSTLINLVPRFYDTTSGHVYVDGVDVRNASIHELRSKLGIVPQKANLFSGDVRSTLQYGASNASDEDLERALEISQSKEFVDKLPGGLDHEIAAGGTNVSGGQRQRLAIARALAKNPEILIFDDSFSALDFKTDAKLRKELNEMCQKEHNTVLLVGQRIASIMHADQIIVLDEGRMVGKGTHDELMKTCDVYQQIAYSQLSKEELENE